MNIDMSIITILSILACICLMSWLFPEVKDDFKKFDKDYDDSLKICYKNKAKNKCDECCSKEYEKYCDCKKINEENE